VAVVDHREPGGLRRVGLLALQQPGLMGVGLVGGEDVEEPAAQDPQRCGVVVGGLGDQVPFGPLDQLRAQLRAQVGGRLVSACRIAWAWSTTRSPAASASRTWVRSESAWASLTCPCTDGLVCRVRCAHSSRVWSSACPATRSLSSATCAFSLVSSTSVAPVSAASMDHTLASVTVSA
jgi:hypothetical protein